MPMIPSVFAAAIYGTVKVAGYAAFGSQLNRVAGRTVSPLKFGLVKTAVGLAGGIAYLIFAPNLLGIDESNWSIWLGAVPIRLLAWSIVIAIFYGFRDRPGLMTLAVLAGVVWSYVLDGVMALFHRVLPSMNMPFC
jgi:hypothetical protein